MTDMTLPRIMTYKEWIKAFPEVLLEEEDCEECEGTGMKECDHCGADMTCEACDGEGKVKSARALYAEMRREQIEAWNKYMAFVQIQGAL